MVSRSTQLTAWLLVLAASAEVAHSCAMPPGVDGNPPAKNNRDFVACHGKLTLGGPMNLQLVDESGNAVQLMGMSSHGLHWFPNCYSKDSIQHLVENWGISIFRAAMYVGENGYASNPKVKDTVKDIVQWCKELGIYVLIDWHILTPGNPNAGAYSGADDFWEEMATAYKDEKHVLYEIANEPNGVKWPEVKAYHDRIIPKIRAIDPETIIICGTPTWSQEVDKAAADPVNDPYNVMYTFHFYAGTHMGLLPNIEKYASQIPIFATEWGTSQASGDGGPYLADTKKYLDMFSSAGSLGISISWAQWSYADKNEVSAALKSGACASKSWDDTSCSGTFLKNYIKANAETCTAQAPVEPGKTRAPPAPTPAPKVTPPSPKATTPSTCPGSSPDCDCDWAQNGAACGIDDASECFCRCCCEHKGKTCQWSGMTNANAGGGSSPSTGGGSSPSTGGSTGAGGGGSPGVGGGATGRAPSSSNDDGLSAGAWVAIILAILTFLICTVAALVLFLSRKRKQAQEKVNFNSFVENVNPQEEMYPQHAAY